MSDQRATSGTPQNAVYDQQLEALVAELVSIDLAGPMTGRLTEAAESDDAQAAERVADDPAFLLRLQERVSAALAAGQTKPDAGELIDQAIDAWLESR